MSMNQAPSSILDPGLSLTLRPMQYPVFFEMFKDGIRNTWTVEEVDFSTDLVDLRSRLTSAKETLAHGLHVAGFVGYECGYHFESFEGL